MPGAEENKVQRRRWGILDACDPTTGHEAPLGVREPTREAPARRGSQSNASDSQERLRFIPAFVNARSDELEGTTLVRSPYQTASQENNWQHSQVHAEGELQRREKAQQSFA